MSFTPIEDDVLVFPGVGGYNFIASGTIYKGQGVVLVDDNTVASPSNSNSKLIGISDSTITDGNRVCIYGPLNIVRCNLSGSVSAGTRVGVISEGYISPDATYKNAIVVKGTATTNTGEILILGSKD